MVTIWDKI